MKIPFNNFQLQHQPIRRELEEAFRRVLDSGWFILGPEVESFEKEFAEFLGISHVVGVASGTDAIALALKALNIGIGDEVITTSMTAFPTITGIQITGAVPVVVDIDPDCGLIDPNLIEQSITAKTKAILPVHLYGQCCDMAPIMAISKKHNLYVIEDCAQSCGAEYRGSTSGTIGHIGCFSFYPTKNLGALGDAGAVVTSSDEIKEKLKMLRNYGQTSRYHHQYDGMNSRLDELQAALLRVKLKYVAQWNTERIKIATIYKNNLPHNILLNKYDYGRHVYHLFPVLIDKRDEFIEYMNNKEITVLSHYPVPVHKQPAFKGVAGHLDKVEAFADRVASLPISPELSEDNLYKIIDAICKFVKP